MVLQSKTYFMRAQSARKKARRWRAFSYPGGTMRSDGDGGVRAPRPTDKRKAPLWGAFPCRISAKPKQAGQAHRSAPHKIPRKSQGVYLTFTPLPAPYPRAPSLAPSGQFTLWRRGLVRRADERGLSPPVSQGTGGVSKGDSVPLRGQAPSGAQRSFPDTPRPSGTPAPDW